MPKFSLLVRVQNPIKRALAELVDSLEAQTDPDWELVLVVNQSSAADWLLVQELSAGRARVRTVLRPDDELLAWSCNHLLPTLGVWTGFLNQHDRLVPDALAALSDGILMHPQAQVLYSDECARNGFNRLSYTTAKGAFDATRLVCQEYLGALTLINTAHLTQAGGFDRLASDAPTQDLYLRTYEAQGRQAFAYLNVVTCQHHRTYLEPAPTDPRKVPPFISYDLYAMRQAMTRRGLNAEVRQEHGVAKVHYRHTEFPGVVAWVVVDDDVNAGFARLHAVNRSHGYRLVQVRVLHQGNDPRAIADYQELTKALGWSYLRSMTPLPVLLNQSLPTVEHDWVVVLEGDPISWGWLNQLMDHARLPGVGAVGGRTTDPRRIVSPGLLGYWFDGWDWNTRGRFNRLLVPHQTSALGSACLLFNTRICRDLGGFREDLDTLWAMDFTMRVDFAGHTLVAVPSAHIQVSATSPTLPAERAQLQAIWPGWKCRYGLHQSL